MATEKVDRCVYVVRGKRRIDHVSYTPVAGPPVAAHYCANRTTGQFVSHPSSIKRISYSAAPPVPPAGRDVPASPLAPAAGTSSYDYPAALAAGPLGATGQTRIITILPPGVTLNTRIEASVLPLGFEQVPEEADSHKNAVDGPSRRYSQTCRSSHGGLQEKDQKSPVRHVGARETEQMISHHFSVHGSEPSEDDRTHTPKGPGDIRREKRKAERSKELLNVKKNLKITPSETIDRTVTAPHDEDLEAFLKTLPEFDRKRRVYNHEPFPEKLYRMLCDAEENKFESIICFAESSRAFFLYSSIAFEKQVGPAYFRHCKYPSFRRQLSMYGFQRHIKGPETGAFYHKLFRRGRPDLLPRILRVTELSEEIQMKLFDTILFPPNTEDDGKKAQEADK